MRFHHLALIFTALPLFGQHWISLKVPGLQIYSTKDQSAALQELEYLQTVQAFFKGTKPFGKVDDSKAVEVISFRSRNEFAPYAFRSEGGGYYFHTFRDDYILIGDSGPRERALVGHEFTHMVATQAGFKLPIWLGEGLADFYSTVEITATQAILGRAPALYLETIRNARWMAWDTLFAVDAASSVYSIGENLPLLYSQSWALTHMLAIDDLYAAHFPQFLRAVSEGQGTKDALQSIYGKNLAQISQDLTVYLKQKKMPVLVLECPKTSIPATAAVRDGGDFEVELALATVLASKPGSGSNGLDKLEALSVRYPERPEVEEELGMLALQQNKKDEARLHLNLAVQRHSKDPEILFDDALLKKEAGAKYAPLAALFQQALDIKPDMDKARVELGLLDYEDQQYQQALTVLSSLSSVPGDSRFEVNLAMAQCYANLDNSAKAVTFAKQAMQAARTDDQQEQASNLLESVERDEGSAAASSPAAPEQKITNVHGLVKSLSCSGGQKQLNMEVEGQEMTFDIGDPDLLVRHASDSFTRWKCGALKPEQLTVVYRMQSSQAVVAKAIELVF